MPSLIVAISLIVTVINSDCDCNYWREAGSGIAHGINQCEYQNGMSRYHECEYHDGQEQYRIKVVTYNNTDCSGNGFGVEYLDMLANPETDDYNCEAATDCTVAAVEEYSNSGYSSNKCTKDDSNLISRITRVTGCCFVDEQLLKLRLEECSLSQIIDRQWDSLSVSRCNSYNDQSFVIIGGYTTEGLVFKRFNPYTGNLISISGPTNTSGRNPQTFGINLDKNIIYTSTSAGLTVIQFDSNSFNFTKIKNHPSV